MQTKQQSRDQPAEILRVKTQLLAFDRTKDLTEIIKEKQNMCFDLQIII